MIKTEPRQRTGKDGECSAVPGLARVRAGFTLLEVMVAIVILVIAMSIAFEAFSGTVRGWKRGIQVADSIKHGDFAINGLTAILDSTIYFYNPQKTYAFTVEKDNQGGYPADTISFVTANGAFMPPSSPFFKGPHRIKLYIDTDDDGNPALFAIAMPAIANPDDFEDNYDAEPMLVSRRVVGLGIQFWDADNEEWTDKWEKDNSIPERIQITVYVATGDDKDEPMQFTRVIEIPVYDSLKDRLPSPTIFGRNTRRGRTTGPARNVRPGRTTGPGRNIGPGNNTMPGGR